MSMKPIMALVVSIMMVLSYPSQGLAQIKIQSRKILPPPNVDSTNLIPGPSSQPQGRLFQPLSPLPETPPLKIPPVEVPERHPPSGRLPPGVYQTYPYTILLMAPRSGIDDRILAQPPNPNSKMPVIKPHIEVVPGPPAKQ